VVFGPLLRSHERDRRAKRLNGGTYVLIAATASIFLFPKLIAITGFLILIFSDLAAALIGKKFGRRKFLDKSVEGSLAFFVTGLIVIAATPKIGYGPGEYLLGAAAAFAATVVEAGAAWIDDNLSIPLTVGFTLWAGYALLFPWLDVYRFG
jgi:dolichol kinase